MREDENQLTTQVILLEELKLKSKKAPRQVETLLVVPKGPRLKSSEVMLYDYGKKRRERSVSTDRRRREERERENEPLLQM